MGSHHNTATIIGDPKKDARPILRDPSILKKKGTRDEVFRLVEKRATSTHNTNLYLGFDTVLLCIKCCLLLTEIYCFLSSSPFHIPSIQYLVFEIFLPLFLLFVFGILFRISNKFKKKATKKEKEKGQRLKRE